MFFVWLLYVGEANTRRRRNAWVIPESLIAGTPVLSSNFPQAKLLMKDGVDSLFYKMGDKKDLENKILYLLQNKKVLGKIKEESKKSGERFLYKHERDTFLKYVCGKE